MIKILGIDPGSRITGFGVISVEGQKYRHLDSGCIKVYDDKNVALRLQKIFDGIREVIQTYLPEESAIEQVFMHKNAGGALKLGQARGAAIVVAAIHTIPVAEYSARQVKQAVVGYGAAAKEQVQHMVKLLLGLQHFPEADAADALAVAICHANMRTLNKRLAGEQIC